MQITESSAQRDTELQTNKPPVSYYPPQALLWIFMKKLQSAEFWASNLYSTLENISSFFSIDLCTVVQSNNYSSISYFILQFASGE